MERWVRIDKGHSGSTTPTPECYVFYPSPPRADAFFASRDPLNALATEFALLTMAPHSQPATMPDYREQYYRA